MGHPWFCKLICPAGTLEGAIPLLFLKPSLWGTVGLFFWNKLTILILILVAAILISRFFCRVICPLGAFYSLFSRISLVKLEFVEGNCVECGACIRKCPTGVVPNQEFDSRECIMCLKCVDACHFRALDFGMRRAGRANWPKSSADHLPFISPEEKMLDTFRISFIIN